MQAMAELTCVMCEHASGNDLGINLIASASASRSPIALGADGRGPSVIDRRTLLAGMGVVLLATPLAAEAQQLLLDRPTPLLVSADEIYQLALQRKLPTAAATRAFVNAAVSCPTARILARCSIAPQCLLTRF